MLVAEDGSPNVHQKKKGPYANQPREDDSPANDINWVIEKAWLELAYYPAWVVGEG